MKELPLWLRVRRNSTTKWTRSYPRTFISKLTPGEVLRSFMERDLGYRNGRSVEIQRVHRLSNRRNSNTAPCPIIARFLPYKNVEEIFSLGRCLEGTDLQMFRDLPLEIIKRRKDKMTVFKQARRQGMRASFSKSQPDKLFINGSFWPPGKCLDATEEAE